MTENETEEPGMGCQFIFALFIIALVWGGWTLLNGMGSDDDNCYHTPGAQEGSAQHDRDVRRCITGE